MREIWDLIVCDNCAGTQSTYPGGERGWQMVNDVDVHIVDLCPDCWFEREERRLFPAGEPGPDAMRVVFAR